MKNKILILIALMLGYFSQANAQTVNFCATSYSGAGADAAGNETWNTITRAGTTSSCKTSTGSSTAVTFIDNSPGQYSGCNSGGLGLGSRHQDRCLGFRFGWMGGGVEGLTPPLEFRWKIIRKPHYSINRTRVIQDQKMMATKAGDEFISELTAQGNFLRLLAH